MDNRCLAHGRPELVGDPVDTLTGAVVDRTLDFRLTGPIELRWHRYYDSSQNDRHLSGGRGWSHEYDRRLTITADGLTYEEPLRCEVRFPPLDQDRGEVARQGFRLRRISAERYELFAHAAPAMEFTFRNGGTAARLGRLGRGACAVRFVYDDRGRLTAIDDSAGRRLRAVEDEMGRLVRLGVAADSMRPENVLVAYDYDDRGNLVSTTDDRGHGYRYEYDEANRLILRRGRKGFQFYFQYDPEGRCVRAMGDDRLYGVALDYVVARRVTRVTRPDGGLWTYLFSARGDLQEIRDPRGGRQRFVRNSAGRPTLEIDPNGNVSTVVYDAAGAATARIDACGRRVALPEDINAPDPFAHRVPVNAAEYEYGRLLHVGRVTLPDGVQVQQLDLRPNARAAVVVGAPDLRLSDPPFEVPPLRGVWWPRPKAGRVFTHLGKLVEQRDLFGRARRWTYDESGNVAEHVDFDGGKWIHDYRAWHFLRRLVDPLGHEVQFSYTPYGKIASFTDAGGSVSEYRYDLTDRLVEVIRHGVVRDRYARDAAGNLIAKHDGDGSELLRLTIGAGNKPIRRTLASGDEHTFAYDKYGRPSVVATTADRVEFAYDSVGNRVCDKRQALGVRQRFRGSNRLVESTVFERFVTRYERRGNRLTILDPGGRAHDIRCHGHGVVERRFSNGSAEVVQYDNHGRCLFKYAERKWGGVWHRRYHWSGEGKLLRIADSGSDTHHEYDAAHRLRRRLTNGRVEHYQFDAASNLVAQPGLADVVVSGGNRLVEANGFQFVYNKRNHIERRQCATGEVHYEYDSRDQLVRIDSPAGEWRAAYDALGRRTRKTWQGVTTEYYWNADQLAAEMAADGRLRLYVYADPLALSPILFIDYRSFDAPLDSGARYCIFSDQLGTPCLVEDGNGTVVWSASIAPFGRVDIDPRSTIALNLRFPGHYFDAETGLHYNRFRYYDPDLGRYLQSDPWGIAGGDNLYAYHANPLLKVDVRGLGEDGDCPPRRGDDDEEGSVRVSSSDDEAVPRLGQQEGQEIVDTIHGALPEGSIAARNSTTTLTETADGTVIVTNSDRVTPEMRQTISDMQEPGGPLDGRTVLVPDDQHNPGYIPPADRDLPPQGPNGTPTGAENHGEQRGIQAANYYDQHGDANGEGHGPADSQWSRSDAGHGGQACQHCAAAQQQNNVHNPTGVQQ